MLAGDDAMADFEGTDDDQCLFDEVRRLAEERRGDGAATEDAQEAAMTAGWAEDEARWMSHEARRLQESLQRLAEETECLLAEVRLARQRWA